MIRDMICNLQVRLLNRTTLVIPWIRVSEPSILVVLARAV
jgi:hypothetical protein